MVESEGSAGSGSLGGITSTLQVRSDNRRALMVDNAASLSLLLVALFPLRKMSIIRCSSIDAERWDRMASVVLSRHDGLTGADAGFYLRPIRLDFMKVNHGN